MTAPRFGRPLARKLARPLVRAASALVVAFAFSQAALAVDDIVKPAATPMPSVGPTVAAAQQFCGDATGKADDLMMRYSSDTALKEVYKSVDYIALADDKTNATKMYTFTIKGHPAHPAAVCRRIVKDGDAMVVKMEIVCEGGKEACDKLRNDFNVMTARMQADVDQKIAAEKK